jgi:hypothetical protein
MRKKTQAVKTITISFIATTAQMREVEEQSKNVKVAEGLILKTQAVKMT